MLLLIDPTLYGSWPIQDEISRTKIEVQEDKEQLEHETWKENESNTQSIDALLHND
jgi:hypothetical protein